MKLILKALKKELLVTSLKSGLFEMNPGGLIELSRTHKETDDLELAEEVLHSAITTSRTHCNNANVFPYTELGYLYLKKGEDYYFHAMHSFIHGFWIEALVLSGTRSKSGFGVSIYRLGF